MGTEPTTFHGIYINSLSCSEVNRHLTGTVTFESDFLKPNEHMVPQSRGIHRRFYDGGTNLTPPPNSQMSACFGRINFKLGKFPYFKAFFSSSVDRYSVTGLNQTRKCVPKLAQPTTYPSLK